MAKRKGRIINRVTTPPLESHKTPPMKDWALSYLSILRVTKITRVSMSVSTGSRLRRVRLSKKGHNATPGKVTNSYESAETFRNKGRVATISKSKKIPRVLVSVSLRSRLRRVEQSTGSFHYPGKWPKHQREAGHSSHINHF